MYCYNISKYLAQRGYDVHVLTSKLNKNTPFIEQKDGFIIHRFPCPTIIGGVNPMTFILNRIINLKADIIHSHGYVFLTSNQAAIAKKIIKVPFLLHLHGGLNWFTPKNTDLFRLILHFKDKIYDPTIAKWMVQKADAVASISKRDIKPIEKLWGINPKKIHWIPNAVNPNEFNFNKANNIDGSNHNIVFIGRLEAWKGIHLFLETANTILKQREDVTFTVVGDGSLRELLENNNYNKKIHFLGQVPHNLVPKILSESSVLVLPSYIEGLPTVCLEALASGVPVVASDVGGTSEIVVDKETGFLVPPGNSKILVNRVMNLLDDEKSRRKMGRNGRNLIEKYYTWDKVVKKTEKIYKIIGCR